MDTATRRWDDHRAKLGEKGATTATEMAHAELQAARPITREPGYMNRTVVRTAGKRVRGAG